MQARAENETLVDNEFLKHAKSGKLFLHVRIEDPEVNARAQERIDKGESIFISLKDVAVIQDK